MSELLENEQLDTNDFGSYEFLENMSGPMLISWDVTNRCNFRCMHCYNKSGDNSIHCFDDELNKEESMKVVEQIINIKPYSMCICGGETLLRNDLVDIVKALSGNGILINMVSNGYLMNEDKAIQLKEAGINFIQISVDAFTSELHDKFRNTPGSHEKALNALKILRKVGIETAASFVPNKLNIHEFSDYVDLIYKTGCKQIRMMPILPMGRGLENFERLEPNSDEYFKFLLIVNKKKFEYSQKGMNIEWGDPLEHMYLAYDYKRYMPVQMEIKSNGDIGVSTYLPIMVGNVRRHTLREYWDQGYKRIWKLPMLRNMVSKIRTVEDFKEMTVKAWTDEPIRIDIIDDKMKEVLI
ncbi:radical SAM protein [Clostridium felsineum]|uniref:radical SAM protein n=1 Tax=Clostridium felsineum TaxID=36839 RepID=UPI00098CE1C2|nr:radical SAM protein [Clostridium felsineum]URZ03670.1 PqqA peptide cyclase [Clostridium felsineum]